MARITINVTHRDIQCGRRGSRTSCPVALAFFNAGIRAIVHGDSFSWWKQDEATGNLNRFENKLPYEAKRFIGKFDHDRLVEPFFFEIEV